MTGNACTGGVSIALATGRSSSGATSANWMGGIVMPPPSTFRFTGAAPGAKMGSSGGSPAPVEAEALKAAGAHYEAHTYPGTQHGFHNNSTPRYNEAAAKLSWERTVAFFKKNLA